MASREQWLTKLTKLRVDRHKGYPAPYKPLLLLVVLDLAEQGQLPPERLPLTPELAFRFYTYWSAIARRGAQRPDVRYPFHHLQSDGCWTALGEEGLPSPHRRLTRGAALNPDFVAFAQDAPSREQARRILIAHYFQPGERVALYTILGLPVPAEEESQPDATGASSEQAQKRGREASFRLTIVAAYNYTCALTRHRLTTIAAGSLVDAAHIHQFADSRNNDPRNGLALSKNAHWLFDNGLWTLADDYTVLVALSAFSEDAPHQTPLRDYHGEKIQLPVKEALWPDPGHLAWHRAKKFQGR